MPWSEHLLDSLLVCKQNYQSGFLSSLHLVYSRFQKPVVKCRLKSGEKGRSRDEVWRNAIRRG